MLISPSSCFDPSVDFSENRKIFILKWKQMVLCVCVSKANLLKIGNRLLFICK